MKIALALMASAMVVIVVNSCSAKNGRMTWRDSADIEIYVTQYDIDMALAYNIGRTDWYTDPIVHAIARKLGHKAQAEWLEPVKKGLGYSAHCDVYYETETREYDILGSDRAGTFLLDWWHGRKVEPQKFTLRLTHTRKKRGT